MSVAQRSIIVVSVLKAMVTAVIARRGPIVSGSDMIDIRGGKLVTITGTTVTNREEDSIALASNATLDEATQQWNYKTMLQKYMQVMHGITENEKHYNQALKNLTDERYQITTHNKDPQPGFVETKDAK